MDGLFLFSIGINDFMIVSEIDESKTIKAKVSSIDETYIICPTGIIELDKEFFVIVVKDNNA